MFSYGFTEINDIVRIDDLLYIIQKQKFQTICTFFVMEIVVHEIVYSFGNNRRWFVQAELELQAYN